VLFPDRNSRRCPEIETSYSLSSYKVPQICRLYQEIIHAHICVHKTFFSRKQRWEKKNSPNGLTGGNSSNYFSLISWPLLLISLYVKVLKKVFRLRMERLFYSFPHRWALTLYSGLSFSIHETTGMSLCVCETPILFRWQRKAIELNVLDHYKSLCVYRCTPPTAIGEHAISIAMDFPHLSYLAGVHLPGPLLC